ncbi:Detected protein of unknown function [Hibiscus syriacus]|uniref:Uncharacterized protein n=1 Tax=Hibiscus syriacus TaxID=106335 RepID=A0A6A2X697_HIBSY|nr:Detected protein of unknown function [Hibiscus syriacus]
MATKFDIEKFNGRNFSLWKLKMKAILRINGCLAAISEMQVDFTDDNKWIEMDGNAMANFHLALAYEVLASIEEKNTAKEIWDHLTKLYEATSLHNKIFLKRKLYTLYMSESTSVTEHLNTLKTLFSQLTSLSCKIGEQERAELLLQSLPDSYDQLIINLTNSNVTSLVFDDVAAVVLQEENRRKNKEDRQVNIQQAEALTKIKGDQQNMAKAAVTNMVDRSNTANTSDDGDALCCEASTTVEGGSVYSCNDHALEIIGVGTIKLKMYDGTIKVVRDRILRYIKVTSNVALCYGGSNLLINGYVDSDYAEDLDESKSTTGYVFKIAGGAVSWVSKLQSIVATSTTEAEYVAATQASKEAIWLKMLLEELGHNQEYVSMFCDSQSALHLARNPAFHSRTKYIRVQYHFIREKVEEGTVDMQKIHTKDNIANFMTKAINADKFTWCRSSCGLSETIFITFSLKTIPIVATPTTYTTTKTWPPPLPSHDHNHHRHHPTSMLGLHNIFLVAPQPPPTSQESHQPQQQQPSSPPPPPPPPPQAFYQYYNLTDTNIWTAKRSTTTQESLPVFQMKDGVLTSVEEDDEEEDGGGGSGCFKVCRDCGNRAKKECRYSRCRTCCKSRGYDCATHVKSTWVPAARKKDRKVVLVGEEDGGGSSGSSSCGGKRQRVLNFTSNAASKSLNFEAATSQDSRFKESLPGQVRAPAVFRCIQVTAISDGEAEVAYQATVNISGHVFKGFLYDHGVDVKNAFPCISNVVFESSSNGREKERDSSSPIVDPPNTFAASSDRRSV